MSDESSRNVTIVQIRVGDRLLAEVVELADRNTQWLGFFPKEAWNRSARIGGVLAATDATTMALLGYVLFNVARGRAVLQQLCITEEARKGGVARKLVGELKSRTQHLDGISLHCARDFPAHDFWPKVGFVAVGSKPGRGKDPRTLTRYWFDHGSPSLFSSKYGGQEGTSVAVVLDANIFFDLSLRGPKVDVETMALEADWLAGELGLRITDETFNEINRNADPVERDRSKNAARSFPKVEADWEQVSALIERLQDALSPRCKTSDESDIRHLAWTIAADVRFFLTRDDRLLRNATLLLDRFGVRVLRPAELITHLDELRRESDYAPARLAGSGVCWRRIGTGDIATMTDRFLAMSSGEKKHLFRDRMCRALASPTSVDAFQVFLGDDSLALSIIDKPRTRTRNVHFLRCHEHQLAPTVVRHVVAQAIGDVPPAEYNFTLFGDDGASDVVIDALRELGFTRVGERWSKLSLRACGTPSEVLAMVESIRKDHGEHSGLLDRLCESCLRAARSATEVSELVEVERLLFPARLADERLCNFIVPIQPRWAKQLFDAPLALEDLLPSDESIALRCENVYYRSGQVPIVTAPSHVLWYVTADKGSREVRQVRACSAVDEVVKDVPKALFRRFQRLGVYSWRDVLGVAKNDDTRSILAFRFGATELFDRGVRRKALDDIIFRHGGAVPPLSMPYRISPNCFREIHSHCMS